MINTKILRLVEVPRTTGQRVLVLLPTRQKSKFSLSLVCKFLMEGFKFKTKLQEARCSTMEDLCSFIHGEPRPRQYTRERAGAPSLFLRGLLDRELSAFAVGSHGDCGTLEPA